ncbi:hypothetical protein IJG76_01290 [Candidatus Saccharibacteria bacterium]|nr:hypothetical protein [Candidatus Saccharibacteria bacterium]
MSKVVFGQKNERTVERVVNLALFPINLYEDNTGRIFHYDFCKAPTVVFEETEADKTDQRPKIYVVDDELLEHFKKEGYPLENVAVVKEQSTGRNNKTITRLVLATDPDISVRLRVNNIKGPESLTDDILS